MAVSWEISQEIQSFEHAFSVNISELFQGNREMNCPIFNSFILELKFNFSLPCIFAVKINQKLILSSLNY